MALNDYKLKFTKNWTNPSDFPTYENREDQVRADLQCLFDEMREAFNNFLTDLAAGIIPFSSTEGVPETNIQAAIENVQEQAASAAAGTIPNRSLEGVKLVLKAIGTEEIDDGAIDTAQIAEGAVTSGKIHDGAVGTSQLADEAVATAKIDSGAVTTEKIAGTAVTAAKIAAGAVETGKIADGAVTMSKIADSNVTTAKIADANVTTAKIADANVTTDKIADANVTTAKIADSNVTTAKIADANVTRDKLAEHAVSSDFTVTIPATSTESKWTGSPGSYTQEITVTGLVSGTAVTVAADESASAEAVTALANITFTAGADKLTATSTAEVTVDIPIDITQSTNTYDATLEAYDHPTLWEFIGPPFVQDAEVSGLVPVDPEDPTTTATFAVNSLDEEVIAAYALVTLTAKTDAVGASTNSAITVDIPVTVVQNNSIHNFTLPAASWAATGAPMRQEITVEGLLADDQPIVDLVAAIDSDTYEPQLEDYGKLFKMVASADDTLTLYATEAPGTSVDIRLLCMRK